jgi:phosphoribosylamine--glycine ligase
MIDEDLAPHLAAAADGSLLGNSIRLRQEKRVGVVLASKGYPGPVSSGAPIDGLDAAAAFENVLVFHSGTAEAGVSRPVTAGGRVLTIVGAGDTFTSAIGRAYEAVSKVSFDGMQYRRDIGRKATSR